MMWTLFRLVMMAIVAQGVRTKTEPAATLPAIHAEGTSQNRLLAILSDADEPGGAAFTACAPGAFGRLEVPAGTAITTALHQMLSEFPGYRVVTVRGVLNVVPRTLPPLLNVRLKRIRFSDANNYILSVNEIVTSPEVRSAGVVGPQHLISIVSASALGKVAPPQPLVLSGLTVEEALNILAKTHNAVWLYETTSCRKGEHDFRLEFVKH